MSEIKLSRAASAIQKAPFEGIEEPLPAVLESEHQARFNSRNNVTGIQMISLPKAA
jgi:hypothetical protein